MDYIFSTNAGKSSLSFLQDISSLITSGTFVKEQMIIDTATMDYTVNQVDISEQDFFNSLKQPELTVYASLREPMRVAVKENGLVGEVVLDNQYYDLVLSCSRTYFRNVFDN